MNKICELYSIKNSSENFSHGGKRIDSFKEENNFKPLISIITVVKNGERFLNETFKSVFNQSFKNWEYIVIDGNSTDKTIDIIKDNQNMINYWVSEKDDGIYYAFNKGLSLARGQLIGFVNSDDTLEKNALNILSDYYKKNPDKDFFFGAVKKHWGVLHGFKPEKIHYSWGFYSSHSTGFFIKKEAAKKVGYYNVKYKYHSDYDYFYRMIVKEKLKGIATKKNELFGVFRRGGFSSSIPFRKLLFEEIKIRYDNNQNLFLLFVIFSYKIFKNFKKFVKNKN